MLKTDPVPWNIYIRAASDIDIDDLLKSIKQRLSDTLPPTIEQLTQLLAELDKRKRDEPSILESLLCNGASAITLVAQLELLERLKDKITPRPPVILSEAEATRIADARWKEWDKSYDNWDFSRAMSTLREQRLVRLRIMPKTGGCRYTFLKPPGKYPNAYRIFRRCAEYFQLELGYNEITFVGLWDRKRGTPPRVVVTAAIVKARRREMPPKEAPLDTPDH